MLSGLDISNHQGPSVDFAAVAASGQSFVWAKASEGIGYIDPHFERNWREIKAHGMLRGAYHFLRADLGTDPIAEVDFFLGTVGPLEAGDLLALDFEAGTGNLSDWVADALDRVYVVTGARPFLYSGTWIAGPCGLLDNPRLWAYPAWWAIYTSTPPTTMPPPPGGWPAITIVQWTSSGSVPGVNGDCDCNVSDLTADQLRALGKPGATSAPVVTLDKETQRQAKMLLQEIIDRANALNTVLQLPDWSELE